MAPSKPVTETVILHLRQGVPVEDVYSGRGGGSDTPVQAMLNIGNTLKEREGCIRQFWGTRQDNPSIFVWTIDWESFDHHANFMNAPEYRDFMAGAAQVFDFEVAAPLMMHTAFTSDAVEARKATVTELAFFTLAKSSDEATKTKLEDSLLPIIKAAADVGDCSASALGWVFEDQEHPQAPGGQATALQVLNGWPSMETALKFTGTPEFASGMGSVMGLILPPIQEKHMFFVEFHAGV